MTTDTATISALTTAIADAQSLLDTNTPPAITAHVRQVILECRRQLARLQPSTSVMAQRVAAQGGLYR